MASFSMLGERRLGMMVVATLAPKVGWLSRFPLEHPPEELAGIARSLAGQIGYRTRPADAADGFLYDQDYLRYVQSPKAKLATGRLESGPIRFWYRESQDYLEADRLAFRLPGRVTPDDPPMTMGMLAIVLDPQGRLLRFEAIPDVQQLGGCL